MIVFAVSGLWHGADWTFVIWGLMHGGTMCLEALFLAGKTGKLIEKKEAGDPAKAAGMLRRALTFAFVCFTWIFFRAGSLRDAFILVGRLFEGYGIKAFAKTLSCMGMTGAGPVHIMLVIACLTALEKMRSGGLTGVYSLSEKLKLPAESEALLVIIMVMTIAASWLMLLAEHAGNVFIYFRF